MTTKEKFLNFIEKYYVYVYASLLFILAFCCFFRLGSNPVRLWDESRHGVNAYEMIKNNNYVVNYFNGNIDYWNLKPPISYYTVILGYKIFGYNAFGLRFFSALFYFLTIVLISMFLKKEKGKFESLISVILGAGLWHMLTFHYARTGDAEGVYVFFITIAMLALYKSSKNANYLYLVGTMFALAFLTKSFHAVILVPIVFFYLLFTKGFKTTKWWQLVLFFVFCLIPILIWGLLRYKYDGITFFKNMLEYDLLNRSSNSIEGNTGYPFFYLVELMANFVLGFCLILSVVYFIIKLKNKNPLTNLEKLCVICVVSIFAIYGISKTKLSWYTFPCLAPLLISGSILLAKIFKNNFIHKKLMLALKIFSIVVIVAGIATSITLITIKKTDNLQNFISSIQIEQNSKVFFQDENSDSFDQAKLLVLEWQTGNYSSYGGYNKFLENSGSYIIMSNSYYDSISHENIEIIKQDDNYILLKNVM